MGINLENGEMTSVGSTGRYEVEGLGTTPDGGLLAMTADSFRYGDANTIWILDKNNGGIVEQNLTFDEGGDYEAIDCLPISLVEKQDRPIANDDYASLKEDTSATIKVLDNDVDQNQDIRENSSLTISNRPENGNATINGNEINFTPNPNFAGLDQLTYEVCDNTNKCSQGIVWLEVENINDAPDAKADFADAYKNQSVTIDILDNDTDIDSEISRATLSITENPANGEVSINKASGKARYIPETD